MPDFGNEFIIESYKIPWLIWIQLVVMILLIILLFFGFSIFTSDASSSASTSTGGAAAAAAAAAPPTHLNKPSSSHRRSKGEVQRTRRNEESIREVMREDVQSQSAEESSSKDSMFFGIFQIPDHPCKYFGVARRAFLKCLGLDSSSELSNRHQHDKQE